MKRRKQYKLLRGLIDATATQYGLINQTTLFEMSSRLPKKAITARMVYILLLTFADERGICNPSQSELARILNVNRNAIVKAFELLREHGFIVTKESKTNRPSIIQIYSAPGKLILPDLQDHVHVKADDFPSTESGFTTKETQMDDNECIQENTTESSHVDASYSIQEDTSYSIQVNAFNAFMQRDMPEEQELNNGVTPGGEDQHEVDDFDEYSSSKPSFIYYHKEQDIIDIYNGKKEFPLVPLMDDEFSCKQNLYVQNIFSFIREWNSYWGYDSNSHQFTENDVMIIEELFKHFSYDATMQSIQDLAERLEDSPQELSLPLLREHFLSVG
jgi:DNA-binding MarR family transcriptional regulator